MSAPEMYIVEDGQGGSYLLLFSSDAGKLRVELRDKRPGFWENGKYYPGDAPIVFAGEYPEGEPFLQSFIQDLRHQDLDWLAKMFEPKGKQSSVRLTDGTHR